MIVASVREFRDKATKMPRSREPILVMRRGEVTGFYFPFPSKTFLLGFKRELFAMITQEIGKQLEKAGLEEGKLLEGAEAPKKIRRRR